jgi:uncharacterized protein YcfJ
MEMNQTTNRLHPLVAGAAASIILVSLLGAAAIAGILPNSHGTDAEPAHIAARTAGLATPLPSAHQVIPASAHTAFGASTPVSTQQVAAAPAVAKEDAEYKTAVVHHQPIVRHDVEQFYQHQAAATRARRAQVAQEEPARQYSSAPAYQQPAPMAQNSPLGIGLGAVVGGLLGSQVGGGKGRTLAAIAGAIGGGYVGNEIAKRNQ